MAVVIGDAVIDALIAAGVVRVEDHVRRVVIDVQVNQPARIYIDRYGGPKLADIMAALVTDATIVDVMPPLVGRVE